MKLFTCVLHLTLLVSFFCVSCKKDDGEIDFARFDIDTSRVYVDDAYENRMKDSIWFYYKYFSLWETSIQPNTANIEEMSNVDYLKNNYTKYFQSSSDVLGYLMYRTKGYVVGNSVKSNKGSGNNYYFYKDIIYQHKSGESKAYDWYSFLDRGGFITGGLQSGYISGFGMDLVYLETELNSQTGGLFVRFVEKNSSAYAAGLRRGCQILSINDDTKIDYKTQKETNFNKLNEYLYSSSIKVQFKTLAGISKTVQVSYKNNDYADAVFADTVLVAGDKKVGYIGISSFLSSTAWVIDKGNVKSFQSRLTEVFDSFSSQGASELVVDLRYNGGGSVNTAQLLADMLGPSTASGKLMFSYKINEILHSLEWDAEGAEFGPVYFSKKGSLNLSKIYFLVSDETASASELLINILSPYMKVYLIGNYKLENNKSVAKNTYGKPVGFFPIDIVSSYNQLYVTSFQMFNKDGYGNYFDGLKPDTHVWEYSTFHDFGQQNESMLASALNHIKSGVFAKTQQRSVNDNKTEGKVLDKAVFGAKKVQGMYKFPTKKINF